ncbi:hypothetical protein IHE51_02190 [Candidatus Parvarchaeota archaeon]|uniref:Uncharacterized protein n=1 Tax=Candidatus Acidifodinimicrobium mancum TaxID=2898728 RepID=A0A8T3UYZ3_9ARCH|nr:hypothetical protein [Candidatus Acidifodinimicrobium mancum]MBE5729005.1 hypothetical protein [Candidatus Acidifodinimicrobium mancum]MBE5729790.1 hypothetical protein [Candidatus Acidifodinimicrobium mancum]
MGEPVERISAAVVVLVFLVIGVLLYLFLIPPAAVTSLVGNFTNLTYTNTTRIVTSNVSSYYPITSYIGGNNQTVNFTYPLEGFTVSYSEVNSSISEKPFTLTSSIFGSASNNMKFTGNGTDSYYLLLNVSSVSGTPYLKLQINGKYFYSSIAEKGVLKIAVPSVSTGSNVLSIDNYLNGFALSQSISFSNVSLIQSSYLNTKFSKSIGVSSMLGLGNYILQFTPIGYGNMSVSANGVNIYSLINGSNAPLSVSIPESVVNSAISTSKSVSNGVVPLTFNFLFSVSQGGRYVVADDGLLYELPPIPVKEVSIPYSVKASSSSYIFSLYVSSIVRLGYINFTLYPSGVSFSIPASSLSNGENIVVEPSSYLAGNEVNGKYTGTVTLSSDGLIMPSSLTITPSSS